MYRLIDHKQNILRPKGDQSFHTVCAKIRPLYVTHSAPFRVSKLHILQIGFAPLRVNVNTLMAAVGRTTDLAVNLKEVNQSQTASAIKKTAKSKLQLLMS